MLLVLALIIAGSEVEAEAVWAVARFSLIRLRVWLTNMLSVHNNAHASGVVRGSIKPAVRVGDKDGGGGGFKVELKPEFELVLVFEFLLDLLFALFWFTLPAFPYTYIYINLY